MDKQTTFTTTFTKTITKTYNVSDVSPEDGIAFKFNDFMNTAKKFNLEWNLKQGRCERCGKPFKDEDRMYLAVTDQGNIFLCKNCAKELRHKLGIPDYCKPENINK